MKSEINSTTKEALFFREIGNRLPTAEQSQMFGKPCFKVKGKAFMCFFEDTIVFKLKGDNHKEALALSGSCLFDPSGRNRPMKEWVQVGFEHSTAWAGFAEAALDYVKSQL